MDNLSTRVLKDTTDLVSFYNDNVSFREKFNRIIAVRPNIPFRGRPLKFYFKVLTTISPHHKKYYSSFTGTPEQVEEFFGKYESRVDGQDLENALEKSKNKELAVFEKKDEGELDQLEKKPRGEEKTKGYLDFLHKKDKEEAEVASVEPMLPVKESKIKEKVEKPAETEKSHPKYSTDEKINKLNQVLGVPAQKTEIIKPATYQPIKTSELILPSTNSLPKKDIEREPDKFSTPEVILTTKEDTAPPSIIHPKANTPSLAKNLGVKAEIAIKKFITRHPLVTASTISTIIGGVVGASSGGGLIGASAGAMLGGVIPPFLNPQSILGKIGMPLLKGGGGSLLKGAVGTAAGATNPVGLALLAASLAPTIMKKASQVVKYSVIIVLALFVGLGFMFDFLKSSAPVSPVAQASPLTPTPIISGTPTPPISGSPTPTPSVSPTPEGNLRLAILNQFGITLNGFDQQHLQWAYTKLLDISRTRFIEFTRGTIITAVLGTASEQTGYHAVNLAQYAGQELFQVILTHELSHVVRNDNLHSSILWDEHLLVLRSEGAITEYARTACMGSDTASEDYADMITYYLNPNANAQTALCAGTQSNPYNNGGHPEHRRVVERILGGYP